MFRPLMLAAGLAALPLAAPAQELTEDDVKRLALEAILENPDIIMEAVAILRARDEAEQAQAAGAAVAEHRAALRDDPNAPVLGNPEGDVVVVEFFDYNCPYCRQAADAMQGLIAADPDVKVVYREWPILGEGSVFAARAALAARAQDRYKAFHWALMEMQGRAAEASVMQAAREVGLDTDRLRADMEAPEVQAHIDVSMDLARALGVSGTPAFVIGDEVVPGLVPLEELQRLVDAAREDG